MRVVYYLGAIRPLLSGGMVNVMLSVDALRRLGHDARVVAGAPAPGWAPVEIPWSVEKPGSTQALRDADAIVTGWAGVDAAHQARAPVVAHLCAGPDRVLWPQFEREIDAAYRQPTIKLVVAPHLAEFLRDAYGIEATFVGTPIALEWYREGNGARRPTSPRRVLSVGSESSGPWASVPFKGVADVLEIAGRARSRGADFRLVRMAPRRDELMDSEIVDERRVGIAPTEAPRVYRSCDVFLSASTAGEGLGRPAVEAALSGLACVLPRIPSFAGVPGLDDATLSYEPGDLEGAVNQIERLLADDALLERLARAGSGLALDDLFSADAVATRVANALEAALDEA